EPLIDRVLLLGRELEVGYVVWRVGRLRRLRDGTHAGEQDKPRRSRRAERALRNHRGLSVWRTNVKETVEAPERSVRKRTFGVTLPLARDLLGTRHGAGRLRWRTRLYMQQNQQPPGPHPSPSPAPSRPSTPPEVPPPNVPPEIPTGDPSPGPAQEPIGVPPTTPTEIPP